MLPTGGALQAGTGLEIAQQPSRTYRLDLAAKRVTGKVDGLEAVKQAAFKILQTERFENLIYTNSYGGELIGLAGRERAFIESELRRRIREALVQDDRISSVEDMRFNFKDDSVLVEFAVVSQYGNFAMSREV